MSDFRGSESETDNLEAELQELCLEEPSADGEEISDQRKTETDDDGYDSCNSDEKETAADLDDENILEPLSIKPSPVYYYIVQGDTFFKDLLRYPLAREGVYALVGLPS